MVDHGDASRPASARRQKSTHGVDEGKKKDMMRISYAFRNCKRFAAAIRKNAIERQVRRVGRGGNSWGWRGRNIGGSKGNV